MYICSLSFLLFIRFISNCTVYQDIAVFIFVLMAEKSLYFIAVAPNGRLSSEIRTFQKDFADRFGSVKSYNNFPHITVVPPFWESLENENLLIQKFISIEVGEKPFTIQLENFDSFDNVNNPVVFIKPKENLQFLEVAKKILESFGSKSKFNPHLTVAYRDLTRENYEKAWKEYSEKKFSAEFLIEKIGLYKHFNKKWNLLAELEL